MDNRDGLARGGGSHGRLPDGLFLIDGILRGVDDAGCSGLGGSLRNYPPAQISGRWGSLSGLLLAGSPCQRKSTPRGRGRVSYGLLVLVTISNGFVTVTRYSRPVGAQEDANTLHRLVALGMRERRDSLMLGTPPAPDFPVSVYQHGFRPRSSSRVLVSGGVAGVHLGASGGCPARTPSGARGHPSGRFPVQRIATLAIEVVSTDRRRAAYLLDRGRVRGRAGWFVGSMGRSSAPSPGAPPPEAIGVSGSTRAFDCSPLPGRPRAGGASVLYLLFTHGSRRFPERYFVLDGPS